MTFIFLLENWIYCQIFAFGIDFFLFVLLAVVESSAFIFLKKNSQCPLNLMQILHPYGIEVHSWEEAAGFMEATRDLSLWEVTGVIEIRPTMLQKNLIFNW